MKWTSEKPTKPGWYWYRTKSGNLRGLMSVGGEIGNADGTPGGRFVYQLEYGSGAWCTTNALHGQWQGPIEPEDD